MQLTAICADDGERTNEDVIKAVKDITGQDIDENATSVTVDGITVDISSLWTTEE